MFKIIISNKVEKQLKKLPKDIQKRIIVGLERIRIRPEHFLTKLVGENGHKLRIGDYKIIVDINQGALTILVIKIAHRKNVYKGL